ncbi:MAG: hypothetical protein AAFO88_04150, partial [Pseudomonadota bacterium]
RGGAMALTEMLIQIALRIPEGRSVRTLARKDEADLRNWGAEAHRKIVDATRTENPLAKSLAV